MGFWNRPEPLEPSGPLEVEEIGEVGEAPPLVVVEDPRAHYTFTPLPVPVEGANVDTKQALSPLVFRPAAPGETFRSVVHAALCEADQAVKACGGDTPEALIARIHAQTYFNRLQRLHSMLEYNPTLDGTGF